MSHSGERCWSWQGYTYIGAERIWEITVSFSQFSFETQGALKNTVKNKKQRAWRKYSQHIYGQMTYVQNIDSIKPITKRKTHTPQ